MRKRIFRGMLLLTMIAILLVTSAVCIVFYAKFSDTVRGELEELAGFFSEIDRALLLPELRSLRRSDVRVTLIAPDGAVEYDSTVDAATLSSHADREEIRLALQSGTGESRRFSDTLRQETYYYAVRLPGGYVLRTAKTISSVVGMYGDALPLVIGVAVAVMIIGYVIAKRLTRRIVAPINSVDLTGRLAAPYDELVPFIRMIDRQREDIARQMNDLRHRADTISAIMDSMNEGVILIDSGGVVASMNKSASSLLEIDFPAGGRGFLEIVRDVEFAASLHGALAGSRSELVGEYQGKTYRVFFSPVPGGGAIVLFLDITERVIGENMRREFTANVSHELKTPLTSIYGHAEMLAGGMIKETDKQSFYLKIKDEAARLIDLIEDIILISRLDEGKGADSFEDVELSTIASEAADALSLKARECEVTVSVTVGTACGAVLRADYSMIYEMLYNLIDNAVKYNKPGGSVEVSLTRMDTRVLVTVSDTGVGIPMEAQSRVFERFYRVDKSRSKKNGGTGLGLAIVKHIALLHGGVIALQSREGEGTVITVSFDAKAQP